MFWVNNWDQTQINLVSLCILILKIEQGAAPQEGGNHDECTKCIEGECQSMVVFDNTQLVEQIIPVMRPRPVVAGAAA